MVVRYANDSGSKDFLLLQDMTDLEKLLGTLRSRDSVVVMKSSQKIKQGNVDEAFIETASSLFPEKGNWILIGKDHFKHTAAWAYVESELELRKSWATDWGILSVLGRCLIMSARTTPLQRMFPMRMGLLDLGAY
ncbi:MAG: hypothetical protein JWM68_52 [Verrucomicrobiales bacterium]|nr:hypothetical protein [Verrucomicrobiales bacterium]